MGPEYILRRSQRPECRGMGCREFVTADPRRPFAGRVHDQGYPGYPGYPRTFHARHGCRRHSADAESWLATARSPSESLSTHSFKEPSKDAYAYFRHVRLSRSPTEGTTMRRRMRIVTLLIAVGTGIAVGLAWMLATPRGQRAIAVETRHLGGGYARV